MEQGQNFGRRLSGRERNYETTKVLEMGRIRIRVNYQNQLAM